MRDRAAFGSVLLLDLLGAGGALLVARRDWQTALTLRSRPFADDVLPLTGYTVDSAVTALGLVALAGVVAVLATRGLARRAVGAVIALAGGLAVWRSLIGLAPVGEVRARSLVQAKHSGAGIDTTVVPQVSVHVQWPVLSAGCGLLIFIAGVLVASHGHRWAVMSARYESRPAHSRTEDAAGDRARADASMWTALDGGTDPTAERGPEGP